MQKKTALVTGGAARIGAACARTLHTVGFDLVIHYHRSQENAEQLTAEFNRLRNNSAIALPGNLLNNSALTDLIEQSTAFNGRLDVLLNNASNFYATTVGEVSIQDWDQLMGVNLRAPFFLSQAAAPWLKQTHGCILNLVDIHGFRPLQEYPIYSIAKAGNAMLVKALARELGPEIRVNGIAPGSILWPENGLSEESKEKILARTSLKRLGSVEDIAHTVRFLVCETDYITGQIIAVDGGRMLQQ